MELLVFGVLIGVFQVLHSHPAYINPSSIVIPEHLRTNLVVPGNTNVGSADPRPAPEVTIEDAEKNLRELGFLENTVGNRLDQTYGDDTEVALKKFQHRYRLPETGTLDDDTRRLITAPRCGVSELNYIAEKWAKPSLKYKIRSFPSSLSPTEARQLIKQAFDEWTKHVKLSIDEVMQGEADIYVSEEQELHRNRIGQECTFTSNTTVAHAYYPEVGDIHYNSKRSYTPEEFLSASMHEIGHSLGLDHTNSQSSIMFPFHVRYHTKIPAEDRKTVQALYGARRLTNRQNAASAPSKTGPQLCSLNKIDTILNDAEGQTFALAGSYYYPLSETNPEGQLISSKWPRLPANVDAGFTCRNNKTFFLKRSKLWVYANDQLEAGYPKLIADELPGLPNNINAVFVTNGGNILVLKQKQYWFYNPAQRPQVSAQFPRLVYDFRNMPVSLDGALRHTDGQAYFFKDRSFYTMDMKTYTLGTEQPMDSRWFKC